MTPQLAEQILGNPATATRLLWEGAGRPADTTAETGGPVDVVPYEGLCWWCGRPAPGFGRSRRVLPDTFPWPLEAAAPESEMLCLPCGWTLCDRVALPPEVAGPRLAAKAARGARQVVSVRGAAPARWLLLALADGTVGLWTPASRAADEEAWTEAVNDLRTAPRDVGACHFAEAVPATDLSPGTCEKFRAYHHFATASRWWPTSDSQRQEIRAWLTNPPAEPWVGVIGDGKKHHAIRAALLDAVSLPSGIGLQTVYFLGERIVYLPAEIAALIDAVEGMVLAGASDAEITSGEYRGRTSLMTALRTHERLIAARRGSPSLDLAIYLRRNRAELESA